MRVGRPCCPRACGGGIAAAAAASAAGLSVGGGAVGVAPMRHACRTQYFVGEQRTAARLSKAAYSHPLAPRDPSTRNLTIPDSALKGKGLLKRTDKLPAEQLKKKAQAALLRQLQQEVLWEGTVLDEANHKLVQHFLQLQRNPKYRQARHLMSVTGREMIRELYEHGHVPHHLLITEGRTVPDWAEQEQGKQRMDIVLMDRGVAEEIAPGNDGYVGDFSIPPPPLKEELIANKQRLGRVLVLDNVDDAGMLGTILRTATGYMYDAIITTNHCADLYDHHVVRAARGAHFQSAVPIYALAEENGDDVYGMLNHIAERNNLQPVCYTPVDDEEDADAAREREEGVFYSSVVGARPIPLPVAQSASAAMLPPADAPKERLSEFCLNRFTLHTGAPAASDEWARRAARNPKLEEPGYLVFAGPNHKKNLVRKLTQRIARRPVQLLLDSMPSEPDMLVALSVVLHALRPSGNWDYLPVAERSEKSSPALQTRTASVDIGADRLLVDERSFNLDEDEQRETAHLSNEMKKWLRLQRMQKTDYEHWTEAEEKRVRSMQRKERAERLYPWNTRAQRRGVERAAADGGMPDWVPNVIDEYRQPLDRDRLREEREIAENFVRPSNYTQRER